MDESKILITGAKGQLGTALRQKYLNAKFADVSELDITDKKSVENYDWSGTEILINAAAYTNVDGAETSDGRVAAWSINADAVANLVAVAAHHYMTLVHISSDYVFDGSIDNHKEDEAFSPLSVYGASKAAGDIAVSLAPKFYILRSSWVIGEGKNFVRTMLEVGKKGINPNVVSDQIGRLTFTTELVRAIDHLISSQISVSKNQNAIPYGTYNVTNSGKSVSWAEITNEIYKIAGLDIDVSEITTEEYFAGKTDIAPRPKLSTLDLSKIESTGFQSTDWQDDLKKYLNEEL